MTIADIFPALSLKVSAKYARELGRLGFIRARDDGDQTAYTDREAEILKEYVRLIREEKMSQSRALGLIIVRYFSGTAAVSIDSSPEKVEAASTSPLSSGDSPDASSVAELEAIRRHLEEVRLEKEKAERREHQLIAETARMRSFIEGFRQEFNQTRRDIEKEREQHVSQILDLDEERKKARFRISRLEEMLKNGKPRGIFQRFRAALRVFFSGATVVYALPEFIESPSEEQKAA